MSGIDVDLLKIPYLRCAASSTHAEVIERTVALGYSFGGAPWGRPGDHVGVALAVNGISPDHRDYLTAGGYGFMLGDGRLSYAPEQVFEAYYSVALWSAGSSSLETERFVDPAFNADRGPVTVLGLRFHLQYCARTVRDFS